MGSKSHGTVSRSRYPSTTQNSTFFHASPFTSFSSFNLVEKWAQHGGDLSRPQWSTIGVAKNISYPCMCHFLSHSKLKAYLNTLALWQRYPWLLSPNDKDVGESGGKCIINSILDLYNIETSIMAFSVGNYTNTAHVAATSDHGYAARIETDVFGDFAGLKVDLDCVINLDWWVWVTNTRTSRNYPPLVTLLLFFLFCFLVSTWEAQNHRIKHARTREKRKETYVRASWVTKYGIPLAPSWTRRTFASL